VEYLMREGRVVRVGRDRYYDAGVLDRMVRLTADAPTSPASWNT
jgi:hypothetical protein